MELYIRGDLGKGTAFVIVSVLEAASQLPWLALNPLFGQGWFDLPASISQALEL